MVAIVSGNSLGLGQTSLFTLGQHGQIGTPHHGRNGQAAYVNVATGNLVLQGQDDHLASVGADIATVRTYNSLGLASDDNGDNWVMSLARPPLELAGTVNTAGSVLTRTAGDGARASYAYDAARGKYLSREGEGAHDTITFNAGIEEYEWVDGSTGASEHYEAGSMQLVRSHDAAGQGFTYGYDAGGLLKEATSEGVGGERTLFDYTGNLLTQVRTVTRSGVPPVDVTHTRVRYAYDDRQRLSAVVVDLSPDDNAVTDGKVYRTTYTYHGDSTRVATIGQVDDSMLAFTYIQVGSEFRVATIKDALARTTSFTYTPATAATGALTHVKDALGQVTTYEVDGQGQIKRITPPAGTGGSRAFSYADGDVTSVQDGAGRTTTYRYDSQGNRVLERDAAGNTVTRSFDDRNQLLAETVHTVPDPDGAGAGVASGPSTTRHVYSSVVAHQLRFTISASGGVTEHKYTLGLETEVRSYAAAYPDGLGYTEAALQTWAAGQGEVGVRRVVMAYDARGLLASRTSYGQFNLQGVAETTSASTERFVYDQAGRLLQRVAAGGGATVYTYDGLGRVLTATDAAGRTTVTTYQDAAARTLLTLANGRVTTQVHDRAGQLVAQVDAAATVGETRFTYDAAGRLRMTQDPTGVRSWMLHDAAGRKVADVDGNGTLTEYRYDASGLMVYQATYATAVNTGLLVDAAGNALLAATLATLRPATQDADTRTWRAYDAAQRLVAQATATGDGTQAAVTELRYDGASRLVRTIARATLVAVADLAAGAIPSPGGAALDRVTRHFHDADGRHAGTLDAEGYLAITIYSTAGLAVKQVAYAAPVAASLREAGSLQAMLDALAGRPDEARRADIHTFTLYDAQARAVGRVDGEGYLTETVYGVDGNVALTVRYAAKARLPVTPTSVIGAIRPNAASAADEVTTRTYDALGRLASENRPDGLRTTYTYDLAGNLVSTVSGTSSADRRSVLARHDVYGRLVGELSGEGAALLAGAVGTAAIDAIWRAHGLTHTYDAASRRVKTVDQLGYTTLFFHDADGALRYTINHLGEVRENRYDAQGRLVEEIAYVGRISTTGLAGGIATAALAQKVAAIEVDAGDSHVKYTYTAAGEVASRTDALGAVTTTTHNAFGDQVTLTAAGHAAEIHAVDRRGLRTAVWRSIAGPNILATTVYDAFGRPVQATDANGNVRTQAYDRLGRQVVTTDPLGGERSTRYDAFDRVLSQTDALGHITLYSYDKAKRATTVTTPEGIQTTTVSTAHGQVLSVTDGKGNVTSHAYDRNGNLVRTWTALTTTTSNAYDAAGRLVLATDANGGNVAYTYDAAHRLLTRTVDGPQAGAPATGLNLVTTYQYDGRGQRVSMTDPNKTVTVTSFDRNGQVLAQLVDPAKLKLLTTYSYDAAGRVLTVKSPGGTVTQTLYDSLGRRALERVDPDGLDLRRGWTFDRNGNVVTSTDASGAVTRYAYDAADRLVFTVDPVGNVRSTAYDAQGRVVLTRSHANPISIASLQGGFSAAQVEQLVKGDPADDLVEHRVLDDDGRLLASVDGTGGVTRYGYDAKGNVAWRRSYANRVDLATWERGTVPLMQAGRDDGEVFVYDALDRAVFTMDFSGAVVQRAYDDNGNLASQVAYAERIDAGTPRTEAGMAAAVAAVADPARDQVVRNAYDAANRLVYTVDGMGSVIKRDHDANGNVVRHTAYLNTVGRSSRAATVVPGDLDRITTMAYDAADRMVFQVDAVGAVTRQEFDPDGQLIRRTAHASALAKTPALQVSVATLAAAVSPNATLDRVTRYAYDAAGRQVLAIDAEGAVRQTTFDGAGRVTGITAYGARVSEAKLASQPTPESAATWVTADASVDRTTRYAYDAAGRRVYEVDPLGAVTSLQYDGIGNVLATTRHVLAISATTKNTVAAIAAAVSPSASDRKESFDYDAAGQLVRTTDALGKWESASYDGLGRRLTFTNKLGATWTYSYDGSGRVVSETTPEVALTAVARTSSTGPLVTETTGDGPIVTRFTYDALGNLTQRTEAAGRAEQRTTTYTYDALGRQVRVDFPDMDVYDAATDSLTVNGADKLASRSEITDTDVHTLTFYDALGNAAGGRDVGGGVSQKVHDRLGRVVYEIDALGYVTQHQRNAFGEVVRLTRYADAIAIPRSIDHVADAATQAEVAVALQAGANHQNDRVLLSTYDRAGRVVQTGEPSAYVYEHSLVDPDFGRYAGKTTTQVYNAFGEVVQVITPRGEGLATATTTRYHDRAGREIATVDALGYLTTRTFDAVGNLLSVIEYAGAVARGWTTASYGAKPAASLDDRKTAYVYDTMNRKTAETRVAALYADASDGNADRGDLTTSYAYDAVGNQTVVKDAEGALTITYYDALGRIRAVAAPARKNEAGAPVAPLTEFRRDAHGKVVATIDYVNGGIGPSATRYDVDPHAGDRKTFTLYDDLGRVTQATNAQGHSQYFSYDRHGNVAKQWELVKGDGKDRTLFQANLYDKLGRLVVSYTPDSVWTQSGGVIQTITQAEAGLVKATIKYNAFGEMTYRGHAPTGHETFEYDNAGRLWRTNTGDGIYRVNLFDLQGNVTAEIRSSGAGRANEDIAAVADAAAADRLSAARRTDTTYDALGRVTAREEAARREVQGGLTVERQLVGAQILRSGGGYGAYQLLGENQVTLNWNSLSALGSGDVKVTLEYLTADTVFAADPDSGQSERTVPGGEARKFTSEVLAGHVAALGATLTWPDVYGVTSFGISEVTRVIVYKKDVDGAWRAVVDQAPGYGGTVIDIAAPPNPDSAITLEMRKAGASGDTGWFAIGTRDFGSVRRFDADALGPGNYEYRVRVKTPGEAWHETSAGTITLTSPPLTAISASMAHGTIAAGVVSWKPPPEGYGQDFRYRIAGSTGIWSSLAIATHSATVDKVDTRVLADGGYEFELLWSRKDHGVAVSHAVGTFTVGAKYSGTISSAPGKVAISTAEGGTITKGTPEADGESRYLRPVVLQNTDRWGNVVSITDPRSAVWKTTYAYNGNNQVVMQALQDVGGGAAVTRYYHDAVGRQVAVRDARNHVNGQAWDRGGNLIAELHADEGVVYHRYNSFGEKVWTRDAEDKNEQTFAYDAMGRMTGMVKGKALDYSVSTDNKTLSSLRRAITESWTYDALGRQTSHTNGNGEKVSYAWDLRGNLVQTTQPMGQALRASYDAQGRKVAEVDAEGNYQLWTYSYFGRLLYHKDLGRAPFAYTYDNAGQLLTQTSSRGQNLLYSYDAAGQVTRIVDYERKQTTTYVYDLAGRRVREKTVQGGVTWQDNFLSYDAQGRLRDVADARVHITMDYDGAGNRTRIATRVNYQGVTREVTDSSVRYFAYDAMNRQTLVDGIDANGTIGADQGHRITYDKNGNRTSDIAYRNRVATTENVINGYDQDGMVIYTATSVTFNTSFGKSTETYQYDDLNRLAGVTRDGVQIDARRYDGADRVIRSGPFKVLAGYAAALNAGVDPAEAHSQNVRVNRYDANGRMLHQRIVSSDGKKLLTDISWDADEPTPDFAGYVANGYDKVGNVLGYVVRSEEGEFATEYTSSLARFGGYQAHSTSGKSTENKPGTVTHAYDANGYLVGIRDATQDGNNRDFVNDAEGRVLGVTQMDNLQRQLIVNGEVMGIYGVGVDPVDPSRNSDNDPNFANRADFNFGYAPISAGYPSASPGAYQVKTGDTLRAIAQSAYGESALWYRIAEANGLSSDSDLRVGQTLSIPNRVGTVGNDSTTFKPYDPSRMVGDTTPNMSAPGNGGGCGVWGQVLMLVVAVAVTYFTAGAAASALGAAGTTTGASLGTAALAGGGTLLPSASGFLLTTGAATGVASSVIGAAAGAIVSQAVGVATGVIDKFDWKGVALSAVSTGMTAGVGAMGGALAGTTTSAVVGRAMVANAATQGLAIVTGMQKSFSWRGVAASAVGAGLGQAIGGELTNAWGGTPMGDFAAGAVRGLVAGTAAAVVRGGKVVVQQVAVDAFGNALGSSIAEGSSGTQGIGPWFGKNYVNEMDRASDNYNPVFAQDYRNQMDWASDAYNPAFARDYRNQMDSASDAYNPAFEYGYRNALDQASDNFNRATLPDHGNGSDIASDQAYTARLRRERITRSAESERELNRFASASRATAADAAAPQAGPSTPDEAAALLASMPPLTATDRLLMGIRKQMEGPALKAWDPAGDARSAQALQRTRNNIAMAAGGPLVAAPMAGTRYAGFNEFEVEQAGMVASSFMDLYAPRGPSGALSLARIRGVRAAHGDPSGSFGGIVARTPAEASFLRNATTTFGDGSVFTSAIRYGDNIVIQRSDLEFTVQNVRRMDSGSSPFVKNSQGDYETINLHHVGREDGKVIEVLRSHNKFDWRTGGPLHIPGPGSPTRDIPSQQYWKARLGAAIESGKVPESVLQQLRRK